MLKYRLLFFLIFTAEVNLFAQAFKPAANPTKVLEELRKASQSVSSVEADFKEDKYLAAFKNPQQSSGVFFYKKNDRMRWEQQKPSRYTILINAGKLRIGEAGKEKNIGSAGRMASQIQQLMMGLVNGDFQQNKSFVQTCNENSEQYQVVLTPVSNRLKRVYAKIHLVFPKSSLRLKELTFFEKGGDKSIMVFSNEKVNQSIQESVFVNL